MSDRWWDNAPLAVSGEKWWANAPLVEAPAAPEVAPQSEGPRTYSIGEVPQEAASNFISSLVKNVKDMGEGAWHAVTNPVDTATNVGKLALSSSPFSAPLINLATSAIMPNLSEENQALLQGVLHDFNQPKSALMKDLTDAYGGWDNIKRTMAEDPARVLLDAATVATGGELALAKVPGAVGKVGKAAGTIADAIDPVGLAAKGVAKGVDNVVTPFFGTQSGVGAAPLKEAARSGFVGGEDAINFRRAMAEGVPVEEIVGHAQQGVQNIKREAQRIYQVRREDPRFGWSNDPSTLDFTPITKAWKDLVDSYTTKSGKRKVGDAEWNQIQKVGDVVAEWEVNPALRTADDFDGLKQRIRSIYPEGEAPQLRRAVTKMANVVGEQIKRQVPGYARAMKDYSQAADNLWELERAFSLNDKASMQTAMSKLQSVMRNNASTQYGLRNQMLDQIEDAAGTNIRPFLAGNTLSSFEPRGLARIGTGIGGSTVAGTLIGGPVGAAVGAGLGIASSSPKVAGTAYHTAGRLAGLPDRLARRLPAAIRPERSVYGALGRGPRLGALQLDRLQEDEEPRGFFGRMQ